MTLALRDEFDAVAPADGGTITMTYDTAKLILQLNELLQVWTEEADLATDPVIRQILLDRVEELRHAIESS